jgi:hypothetical protein
MLHFFPFVEDSPNTNTSIIMYTYNYIQNLFPKVKLLDDFKGGGKNDGK